RTRSCSRARSRAAGTPSVDMRARRSPHREARARRAVLRGSPREPRRRRPLARPWAYGRPRACTIAWAWAALGPGAAVTLCPMTGAIAAGHPLTAEAGAEILREGG